MANSDFSPALAVGPDRALSRWAQSTAHAAVALALLACSCGAEADQDRDSHAFTAPQPVRIVGFADHVMEPFLTRDGRYLLFNNRNDPPEKTDLHLAERVDDLTFRYRGTLRGANSQALDGVPSLDRDGVLYFVSTRSYTTTLSTLYRGRLSGDEADAVELVPGVSRRTAGIVNFDAEISADGDTLYFVDGVFSGGPVPDTADIVIAERRGNGFARRGDSARLLSAINTSDLEYAPSISADGLTLLFTRLRRGLFREPAIYIARRKSTEDAFGKARRLSALKGFVEAATFAPDGGAIYFHRREGTRYVLYRAISNSPPKEP